MSMPEATVNEDDLSSRWEHDVWRTGKISTMQAVTIAQTVEQPAHEELASRVLRTNPTHQVTSLLRSEEISMVDIGLSSGHSFSSVVTSDAWEPVILPRSRPQALIDGVNELR